MNGFFVRQAGSATVRVTIRRDGLEYLVDIRPRKCPPLGQQLPQAQGRIRSNLCNLLDATFPKNISDNIGVSEGDIHQQTEEEIQLHAQELEKVLWGIEVWEGNNEDIYNWWRQLTTNQSIDFLIVEFVLCTEMRKYLWESLLTKLNLPITKTAIVRIRLEDVKNLESLLSVWEARNPVWLTLLSDPKGDLESLCKWVGVKLDMLEEKGWPIEQVSPTRGKGHLDSLSQTLKKPHDRQAALFLYVGHAETRENQARFLMESEHNRLDWVSVARLQASFGQYKPPISLLIACWLGQSDTIRPIDQLLNLSKVIVAMQLPLSPLAAERFLDGFIESLSEPTDPYSVEGVARAVAHARQKLFIGTRSYIEAVAPVIYSGAETLYDVFLCYNSNDQHAVEELAHRLDKEGLEPLLDCWNLVPSDAWQVAIEKALDSCATCAVLVGPSGVGPWQHEEMRVAIERRVNNSLDHFHVIPVLLPGTKRPKRSCLPTFLLDTPWVEFRTLDDEKAFNQLVSRIQGIEPGPDPNYAISESECPYQGLRVFDVQDAPFFFGREALTGWLLDELRPSTERFPLEKDNRFLAIIGPSGSGKSSLARAGLVAALKQGDEIDGSAEWPIAIFRPGDDPLWSLAVALNEVADIGTNRSKIRDLAEDLRNDERVLHQTTHLALSSWPPERRLVLLADQFEEVFTLCHDEELRRALIDNLVYASSIAQGQTMVLLALRADFYDKCAAYPALAAALSDHQVLVGPMTDGELRCAIERPAHLVMCEFEVGLVEILLHDIKDRPGSLPLLQHTLLELWERRKGLLLTHAAYKDIGGIKGALEQHAEAVYNDVFDESQQKICRRVLLRLTQPGEGTVDIRRRSLRQALMPAEGERHPVEAVVETLASARLVIIGGRKGSEVEQFVEIAHEALIQGWTRLQRWIEEDREALRTHRRLTEAAVEWDKNNRDKDFLYRGAWLGVAKEWDKVHGDKMNKLEKEFLDASAEARTVRRVTARRRVQGVIVGLVIAVIIFVGLALNAFQERNNAINAQATADARRLEAEEAKAEAEIQRSEAEHQRNIAWSRAIAAKAEDPLEVDAERALLCAMEAITVAHTFEAENVLREALTKSRVRTILPICKDSAKTCKVNDVAWSPNGVWLASALSDGTIQLWDANTEQLGIILKTQADAVSSLAWQPDGTQLAIGLSDGSVYLWNVETKQWMVVTIRHSAQINDVAWSPDGRKLASASDDRTVRIWNVETMEPATFILHHPHVVNSITWSPDGARLASASDNTVQVWNAKTGQNEGILEGHKLDVTNVAWSPDGSKLASASFDKTVWIWDPKTSKSLVTLTGHKSVVSSVAWSPDGTRLATGGCLERSGFSGGLNCIKGEVQLWDAQTGENLAVLNGHSGNIARVAWRPNLDQLASASSDGTVRLWDTETGEGLTTLTGHTDLVLDVGWSPDGRQLASASQDKTIRIWNVTSTLSTVRLIKEDDIILSVAWSPEGSQLAFASVDGAVHLWDVKTGQNIATLSGHKAQVNDVAWSSNGMYLASASDDGTVRLWNTKTHSSRFVLGDHKGSVTSVVWSPDSRQLASGSDDGMLRLWAAETGQNIATLEGHKFLVTSVAWSPNGRQIASTSQDNTVQLWDVETNQNTLVLPSHDGLINQIAWSPDGRYLAAAANDRTVRLWKVEADKAIAIAVLTGHTDWVTSVAWSPDGARLASGSYDHTVRLFYSRYTDLMDIAKRQVTRQLSPTERRICLGQ
ncbi:MAG: TIR domain-containing protein [Anaerolineae bacterium]|nr:TIR domain-containing protein [Anaerolineae bacterium]